MKKQNVGFRHPCLLRASTVLALSAALAACAMPEAGQTTGGGHGGVEDAGLGESDGSEADEALPDGPGSEGEGEGQGPDTKECLDRDGDGYGAGFSCVVPDCDDANPEIRPQAAELCDGADNDCDGTVDEELQPPACELTRGVCASPDVVPAARTCLGAEGWSPCAAEQYGTRYQKNETFCDQLDNDCDGTVDEGCGCRESDEQPCGSDLGECRAGVQRCRDGVFSSRCEGEKPPGVERCNGKDDDCDGATDEGLAGSPCALQQGVCSGTTRRCQGEAGLADCTAAEYGPRYVPEEGDEHCDGLDNDCDGAVDEGCGCRQGQTQPCGSGEGDCEQGLRFCDLGRWGPCQGALGPQPESCDGHDNDCDGQTDEELQLPRCPLHAGVCQGSQPVCAGAAGLQPCAGQASYGADYQEQETRCDQLDNDCDDETDEGCGCANDAQRSCGSSVGQCHPGQQRCLAGEWSSCLGGQGPVPEQCNGLDDDCDGSVDEELAAPPCALQQGVCAGATQRCGGATGWLACTPESYGPRWVANETFLFCDGLDNDCDGQFDEECGRPAVLLNEVLYDDPGEDGDCVFVELWGEPLTPLSGVVLQGVDGATGQVYASIDLSGERIQHDGYFLVVDELASPALRQLANMVSPLADLQNGPDSVRLLWNERLVLDALGYGTFAQPEHFAGEGRPAPDVEPGSHAQGVSLTRDEAHTDTGDNAADFSSSATSIPPLPTPRGQPLARILVVLTWSNEEDLDLHLLRPGRGLRSEDDCHFGQDHLDWGEPGEALDDPLLDHDAPSFGPERIFLPEPGEERYLVVVHHYTPQQSSEARLQVFVDGVNTSVRTRLLPADGRDYWTVARLEVGENGGIAVVTVDELVRAAPAFP